MTPTILALWARGDGIRLDPKRSELTIYTDHGARHFPVTDLATALRKALAATTKETSR